VRVIDLALLEANDGVLTLPAGLPGFDAVRELRVSAMCGTPFSRLTSTDARSPFALIVVPAALLAHDLDTDRAIDAHPDRPRSATVRCIVTPDATSPTVNLLGPLVVDRDTGATFQVALALPRHSTRSPLALRG
jgi:flagellar assembly factor FliW